MSKKEDINEWLARQEYPLTKAKVRKFSTAKLEEMRDAGIKFVSVLGSGCDDDCEACRAMKDQRIEIEFATPLPLPDCNQKFCKCLYVAIE